MESGQAPMLSAGAGGGVGTGGPLEAGTLSESGAHPPPFGGSLNGILVGPALGWADGAAFAGGAPAGIGGGVVVFGVSENRAAATRCRYLPSSARPVRVSAFASETRKWPGSTITGGFGAGFVTERCWYRNAVCPQSLPGRKMGGSRLAGWPSSCI